MIRGPSWISKVMRQPASRRNGAARAGAGARPGEVVIGESTRSRLPPGAVVEPLGELVLKGKSEPVVAFRLRALARGT